ncbi:MAG TPA: biotin--[acetyl-CoA-carboxylase] ligase [Steroidobacteraceae bacterium]|nr:biotin--[acetyl-CoA-carboxylase] ligase [Steroidobacteraceae bacterium]
MSDGQFHSGEDLAQALGVSRSAVWKAVKSLRDLGATLHAVRNRGYRLANSSEPLAAERIQEKLSPEVRPRVRSLEVAWSVGSTNTVLLSRPNPPNGSSEVMLAEYQAAGRGRRGRAWLAPPGGAICLSLSWTFRDVPADLSALGLVIGVCELRALHVLGVTGAKLKWPNDLVVDERKLGGILIELRAETDGPACVVIGMGLNVSLGAPVLAKIAEAGNAATDLITAGLAEPLRNTVAAALVNACIDGLLEFERHGLRPFIENWRDADALQGRMVDIKGGAGEVTHGLARGVDLHGALLVETPDEGLKKFVSGEVSVRVSQS